MSRLLALTAVMATLSAPALAAQSKPAPAAAAIPRGGSRASTPTWRRSSRTGTSPASAWP